MPLAIGRAGQEDVHVSLAAQKVGGSVCDQARVLDVRGGGDRQVRAGTLIEVEVGLAAGRLTANQLDQMEQATSQMEECWARQDLIANVEADLTFHGIIVEACSNAMMRSLYQIVRDQLTETQRQPIPITDPERMRASIAEHRRIIAALRANDSATSRLEMETHIRNTARCAGLTP